MSCLRCWKSVLIVLAMRLVTPGRTSEVFRRGRAAYGSVAAIIGSNPAGGASLGQGIYGLVHLFGGGAPLPGSSIVTPSPYGPRIPIEIRADVAAHRRPTNGSNRQCHDGTL
jgi:hypothetical protein